MKNIKDCPAFAVVLAKICLASLYPAICLGQGSTSGWGPSQAENQGWTPAPPAVQPGGVTPTVGGINPSGVPGGVPGGAYPQAPGSSVNPPVLPDQPVVPKDPELVRRQTGQALGAPFTLTPQEEAQLDWVLQRWEQATVKVKTFECRFTRFEYDAVFGSGTTPTFIDQGEIKYVAPDKGLFRVSQPPNVSEPRAEQWICDGKSIYEFDYQKKQLIEYQLPPEEQNRPIGEGPIPFLFGARGDQLRQRYFLRVVTPPSARGQIWLEAWPKWQSDAANFQRATIILTMEDMLPFAMEMIQPNGKNRTVFRFQDPRVNAKNLLDPLGLFEESWLRPRTPPGWTRVVKEAPIAQAAPSHSVR